MLNAMMNFVTVLLMLYMNIILCKKIKPNITSEEIEMNIIRFLLLFLVFHQLYMYQLLIK